MAIRIAYDSVPSHHATLQLQTALEEATSTASTQCATSSGRLTEQCYRWYKVNATSEWTIPQPSLFWVTQLYALLLPMPLIAADTLRTDTKV